MQEIADCLKQLGMAEYAQRFAENRIDVSVLRLLTDQDLKDIDILLGIGGKCSRPSASLAVRTRQHPRRPPEQGRRRKTPPSAGDVHRRRNRLPGDFTRRDLIDKIKQLGGIVLARWVVLIAKKTR
jgi:hypothetical protein